MALSIKDPEADRLARELAEVTGETLTDAIKTALRERLEREARQRGRPEDIAAALDRIAARASSLRVLDDRSPDEIIGYDEHGLPR